MTVKSTLIAGVLPLTEHRCLSTKEEGKRFFQKLSSLFKVFFLFSHDIKLVHLFLKQFVLEGIRALRVMISQLFYFFKVLIIIVLK